MLSKFQYYEDPKNYELMNLTENISGANELYTTHEYIKSQKILLPGWLEYLISFWVFSFFCQEIEQVILLSNTINTLSIFLGFNFAFLFKASRK